MSAKTAKGLVEYARKMLGKGYWYGTFGQTATETLYRDKKRQYPSYYDSSKYRTDWKGQYGERVHDCVGLIKGYLWSASATAAPKYNAAQDVSANGMLRACKEKGKIGTIPDVVGVLVFMDGHVGVYEGNGNVIEARGHDYGVVRTKLAARPWTDWGKCPYLDYGDAVKETVTKPTASTADNITVGATVTIKAGAKYGGLTATRGKTIPAEQCAPKKHTVKRIQTNKGTKEALLSEIQSWVALAALSKVAAGTNKPVTKGCRVKIKNGARTFNGKWVAPFVYKKVYTVDELKGKRAVLDVHGICTAFNTDDLIVQ